MAATVREKVRKARSKAPIVGIFCADTHLDLYAWSSRPELSGDSMWSFEYLARRAAASEAEFLCVAGDVFDVRKPPSEVIRFFRGQIDKLQQADTRFWFVQGQHGMADPPWPVSAHSWCTHLNGSLQEIEMADGELLLYGLDWTPADQLPAAIAAIPEETDILVCHQVWLEFMGTHLPSEGSMTAVPHAHTIFTGDYHECLVERDYVGASGQGLTILSPGSTNMRKIDEPPEKFYFALRADGSWTKHRIPTRPAVQLLVRDADDLADFANTWEQTLAELEVPDGLPERLHKPIAWLHFYDDIEGALAKITAAVKDTAFIFPKVLCREEEEEELVITRQERERVVEEGLAGCLKLLVPQDDPHYYKLLRLIESHEPEVELLQMREERLGA